MTDPLDPSKPRHERVQAVSSDRELRVEKTPKDVALPEWGRALHTDKAGWVALECDGAGNCGGLEPWMVPWLLDLIVDCHDHLMRNPETGKKNLAKLEEIIEAIARILKEAKGED
jgi:hypothetical protein